MYNSVAWKTSTLLCNQNSYPALELSYHPKLKLWAHQLFSTHTHTHSHTHMLRVQTQASLYGCVHRISWERYARKFPGYLWRGRLAGRGEKEIYCWRPNFHVLFFYAVLTCIFIHFFPWKLLSSLNVILFRRKVSSPLSKRNQNTVAAAPLPYPQEHNHLRHS